MKNDVFENIELDIVLENISKLCLFPETVDRITAGLVSSDERVISSRHAVVEEYREKLKQPAELSAFPPISGIFSFVENSHMDIPSQDVFKVGEFLSSLCKMLVFQGRQDGLPEEDVSLMNGILSSLDWEGNVVEDHPRLLPLKRELDSRRSRRARFSASFIRENAASMMNSNPVFHNERIVLPIKASDKNRFECYVQGSSASGQTLFVEPFELVDMNNDVVLAEERIRAEILKIKSELSNAVRMRIPELKGYVDLVLDFDLHYVFALYGLKNGWSHPKKGEGVSLVAARHPLLGTKAVPIDFSVPKDVHAVVISGANAGGKTVTMKTLALCAALNQISGFAPLDDSSELPFFDSFFADIGDGQSIEDSSSTFSSHMEKVSFFARNAGQRSLVLLDELGSGTDPDEGAALSIAVLDYFMTHSRLTLVTSHYSKVKNHAYLSAGMENASMEFDERTLQPTYRVIPGIPGDSHAIETARRMRVPEQIIRQAEADLGDDRLTGASIISSLMKKSRTLDRKIGQAEERRREAERKLADLEKRIAEVDRKEFELEKSGSREISSFISASRKQLENLIRAIRTGELDDAKIKDAKRFISQIEAEGGRIEKKVERKEDEYDSLDSRVFSVGENVLCGSNGICGRILSKNGRNGYLVILDSGMKLNLKACDLRPASEPSRQTWTGYSTPARAEYQMDVRGLTLEQALSRLDDQMEAAVLSGLRSFSIIHGYGDGILMRGIHDYLKRRREVCEYRFARPEDGGMGKTYVELQT